ncbi:MAG TPA: hypothetical protein DCL41_10000 [Bdellovibrionales bacterium]|nr:hypothetical protein [Pseudobdellovibrionaceae bacterium]HAG92196.1 hypothetical protein [Bdellovibrionales bacterium]|tara:strand:+ start:4675 stop:5064 length:390 start_codon:yes stop_codon:yes gene_type:complete
MKTMNRVFLIGNLGHEPELRESENGQYFARLNVATHRYIGKGEDRQEEVQWHNVYAWGKTAETCCAHLSKGALLFVEGEVRQIQTSKKSENSSPMTIVHAHQIRFLKTNKGRTLDNFGPARNHDAVAHR